MNVVCQERSETTRRAGPAGVLALRIPPDDDVPAYPGFGPGSRLDDPAAHLVAEAEWKAMLGGNAVIEETEIRVADPQPATRTRLRLSTVSSRSVRTMGSPGR
jgi:hypothetical protein